MGKTYINDFVVALGPLQVLGKLELMKQTGASEYKRFVSVCPDDGSKAVQFYSCENTQHMSQDKWHVHKAGELAKGKQIGDEIVPVSKEELDEARKSPLPSNVLHLTIHRREELFDQCWPADTSYVFVPRLEDSTYDTLVELVRSSGFGFVGPCNLRNNEGLFRLEVWQGRLIIQKLLWPEELAPMEPAQPSKADLDLVETFTRAFEAKAVAFDPATYRSAVKEQLEITVATMVGDTTFEPRTTEKVDTRPDLMALVESWAADEKPKAAKGKKKAG